MSMRDQVCMRTLVSRVEISLDFLENVIQEVLQDAKELLWLVLFVGHLFKPFKSSRELEPQLTDRWRWQDIFGNSLLLVLFDEVILNFWNHIEYVLDESLGVKQLCSQITLIIDVGDVHAADSAVVGISIAMGSSHGSFVDTWLLDSLIPVEIFLLGWLAKRVPTSGRPRISERWRRLAGSSGLRPQIIGRLLLIRTTNETVFSSLNEGWEGSSRLIEQIDIIHQAAAGIRTISSRSETVNLAEWCLLIDLALLTLSSLLESTFQNLEILFESIRFILNHLWHLLLQALVALLTASVCSCVAWARSWATLRHLRKLLNHVGSWFVESTSVLGIISRSRPGFWIWAQKRFVSHILKEAFLGRCLLNKWRSIITLSRFVTNKRCTEHTLFLVIFRFTIILALSQQPVRPSLLEQLSGLFLD